MAEEKPHEATPGKISKARKEGNVAKTPELNGAFAFMAGSYVAFAIIPLLGDLFLNWIRDAAAEKPFEVRYFFELGAFLMLPMLAAGFSGAFLNFLQTQGFITVAPKFDLKRINPAAGFKKMFSMESVVNAVRAFISACLTLVALQVIVREVFSRALISSSVSELSLITQDALNHLVASLFGIGLLFAVFDYIIVLQRWKKGLRMTHDEVKRDFKENNGDPQIKGKRKQLHRQLLQGPPAKAADATMVVTNPTHFAVALEYRPPAIPVPRVLCRGADEIALEVRRIAERNNVPIVENIELARTLFARGRPGREIPEDTYLAVARIVAALQRNVAEAEVAAHKRS